MAPEGHQRPGRPALRVDHPARRGPQAALEWKFREGWPCKWEGPTLNAKNNEVAIETLEICHEGLELA